MTTTTTTCKTSTSTTTNNSTKKVALYIRVSTSQQTTENQRLELEAYCKRQGWMISKVYDDSGFSGKNDERPALQEMLGDSSKGKFGVVVCWKIDRLARSTINLLQILSLLRSAGVDFVATTQNIDTTNSAGRMLMTFLGAIAEFERETIVERVRAGLDRAKANGVKLGRPRVGIDLKRAIELQKKGLGVRRIAKEIGVNYGSVYRYLKTMKTVTETPA